MSVLVQTSYGDFTIDLNTARCPTASKNFIKLCKMKHYNNALFMNVQKNYIARVQTKKPTTVFREVYKEEDYRYFQDQIDLELRLNAIGLVCTANLGPNLNDSEFFITLTKDNLTSLNGKHSVFGRVQEGIDILKKINESYVDGKGRPYMNVRILHTHVLDDPFEDLEDMKASYPSPALERDPERLEVSEHLEMTEKGKTQADIIKATRQQKAKKQAVTLQILGELPDADAKPPENVLFVCKLNPITEERDLQVIFSRFGPVKSCEIVRDWKTGQSLQYGFIQYENSACCEEAYLKMDNVLIDDRRIHVDFCQSVSKLWPKHKKQQLQPVHKSGQLKQQRKKNDLVPKFREGKQYYGERSNKYDMVVKYNKKNEQNKEESQQQPQIRPKETKQEKPPKQRSRQRGGRQRQRERSKGKRPQKTRQRERDRSRSDSERKKKRRDRKKRNDSSEKDRRRSYSRSRSRDNKKKQR